MRILPVPIYYLYNKMDCTYFSAKTVETTHNNDICKLLTSIFSLYIQEAIFTDNKNTIYFDKYDGIINAVVGGSDIIILNDLLNKKIQEILQTLFTNH